MSSTAFPLRFPRRLFLRAHHFSNQRRVSTNPVPMGIEQFDQKKQKCFHLIGALIDLSKSS